MNEEFELLIVLVIIMLWSTWKYPKNYYFNSFWVLMISIYGVIVISLTGNTMFPITLMSFNILINFFHLKFRSEQK